MKLYRYALCLSFWGAINWLGQIQAQPTKTYQETTLKREVPAEVRTDLHKSATEIVQRLNKSTLSEEERQKFAYRVAIEMRSYHLASQLFYDGPMYDYVNMVADKLLREDAATRNKIHIYISRSTTVNALTFPDGSILVNLGLLVRLHNEAELAFVLAHEIAHFQRQHGLLSAEMDKTVNLKRKEVKAVFDGTGDPDRLLSLFKFSRENETEADLLGLALLLQSDYAPQRAISALQALKTAMIATQEEDVNLYMHFQKGEFQIDTAAIRAFTRSELEAKHQSEKEEETKKKPKFDVSELSTHPEIDARIATIEAKLKETPKQVGKSENFLQPQGEFETLVAAASYESLLTWKESASYIWALYNALKLLEAAPDNQFLAEQAAQNLFWIYANSDSADGLGTPKYDRTENPGLANLLFFFQKLDQPSLATLLRGFLEGYQADFPQSEVLLILQGRLATLTHDKATANSKYDEYLNKFPNGNHAPFAAYQKQHAH